MNKIKVLSFSIALISTTSLYAQTTTENKTTPYGDNPNIFKVLAHKTGDAIQNTAQKVGTATENGIRKIKPKFDETVENTKTYTAEQATTAKENTQKGIDTAVKKAEQTKDKIMGKTEYNVPIEQRSLSGLTTPAETPSTNTAATPAPTVITPPVALASQPSTEQNTQVEPEITKQSLPIENATPAKTADSDDNDVPR